MTKKKMTEFISFRVSPEVMRKLTEICDHNQESRSQVLIGLIITEYVRLNLSQQNLDIGLSQKEEK